MDREEAKQILRLYRPETEEAGQSPMGEALALARRDPELNRWFDRHCAVQQAIRARFRTITAPPALKDQILAGRQVVHVAPWRRLTPLLAMAAAVVLAAVLLWPRADGGNQFAAYRDRMVRTALRDYKMDLLTKDLRRIREYLAEHQAPGDYLLTPGLEKLPGLGCASLRWQGNRVAMVCFDHGNRDVLFLFIVDRSAVAGAPATETPQFASVNKLVTASWSVADKTYVLAGHGDRTMLERLF